MLSRSRARRSRQAQPCSARDGRDKLDFVRPDRPPLRISPPSGAILIGFATLAAAAPSCWSLSEPLPPDPCAAGQKLCAEQCVSLDEPAYGCAADSCEPCADDHGTATCSAGSCAIDTCDDDYGDCNGSASDGCETYLVDNAQHCGICGYDCLGTDCAAARCGQIQIAADQYRAWAVVANDTHVYWTNDLPQGGVWRTPRDATEPSQAEIFAHVDGPMPRGLAIDETHVYWVAGYWEHDGAHDVRRAALTDAPGTAGESLNGGIGGPREAAGIAIDADRVYWTDSGDDLADPAELPSIWSVDKAGTETPVQVAVITMGWGIVPNLIAVDQSHVYWTTTDSGSLFYAPKTAVQQEVTWPHCYVDTEGPGWGIALDDGQAYWREGIHLRSGPKRPADCTGSTTMLGDRDTPRFMVRDGRCLFWMYNNPLDPWVDSSIVVTRTDGTDIAPWTDTPAELTLAIGSLGAHGIAVDDQWVYWTDWSNSGDGGVYKVARPPVDCD